MAGASVREVGVIRAAVDAHTRLAAYTCWSYQRGNQLIGTGHFDPTWLRVGMIRRQHATPRKCVCFGRLSWAEVEAGHVLSPPIVDRVAELDGASWAVGCNVNGCCIGHR